MNLKGLTFFTISSFAFLYFNLVNVVGLSCRHHINDLSEPTFVCQFVLLNLTHYLSSLFRKLSSDLCLRDSLGYLIYKPISMPVHSQRREKMNKRMEGSFFCQETKAESSLTDAIHNTEFCVWVMHMEINICSFFSS